MNNNYVYVVGCEDSPVAEGVYEDYELASRHYYELVKDHIDRVEDEFKDYMTSSTCVLYIKEIQDTLNSISIIRNSLNRDHKDIKSNYTGFLLNLSNLRKIEDHDIWEGHCSYFETREINKRFVFHY